MFPKISWSLAINYYTLSIVNTEGGIYHCDSKHSMDTQSFTLLHRSYTLCEKWSIWHIGNMLTWIMGCALKPKLSFHLKHGQGKLFELYNTVILLECVHANTANIHYYYMLRLTLTILLQFFFVSWEVYVYMYNLYIVQI